MNKEELRQAIEWLERDDRRSARTVVAILIIGIAAVLLYAHFTP